MQLTQQSVRLATCALSVCATGVLVVAGGVGPAQALLTVVMTITGASLGVLLANASVPRVRVIPLVAVISLTLVAAGALLLVDPGSAPAALLFVAASGVGSTMYAGALWKESLPQLSHGIGWFCWTSFAHPRHLRGLYREVSPSTWPSAGG